MPPDSKPESKPNEENRASDTQRLDELFSQGEALIEARRNPARGGKKFPDFGEAYDLWNADGQALIAELSGPAAAARWRAGWCRAMYSLDLDADYCLKEQERQQTILVALRRRVASSTAAPAPATKSHTGVLRDDLLLKDLRRVARKLKKKTLTANDYERHGRSSVHIIIRRFHGWNNALAAARLEVPRRYRISTLELFENLKRVQDALGGRPRRKDMTKPRTRFTRKAYYRRFGSWRRALAEFAAWSRTGKLPKEPAVALKTPRKPGPRLCYLVFKRDGYKCTVCGKSPVTHPGTELQADHIKAWSRGGPTTLANLTTLCRTCNSGKGDL